MEKINEQTKVLTEQTAVAEEDIGNDVVKEKQEVSLGKFKDVSALKGAYDSLQAEFTKRCQRIKELESQLESVDKTAVPTNSNIDNGQDIINSITEKDKENILKDYLKEILNSKQKAIVLDGAGLGVKTPTNRPKTIEEAGRLATDVFKK